MLFFPWCCVSVNCSWFHIVENSASELKSSEAMIEAFPEEIRHDILFRLPIKCLIRCTSVSKPWLSIVKNSGFIRAHLRHQHEALILLHGSRYDHSRREATDEVYCLHRDNPSFDEYSELDFQIDYMVDPINGCLRVAGTCDGLVCLADDILSKAVSYIIWNPSIRKLVTLPRPGYTFTTHGPFEDSVGFGFDATANDYKVVRLVTLEILENKDVKSPTVAEVYSLATGLVLFFLHAKYMVQDRMLFFNGNIHWVVNHWKDAGGVRYFILAFDLGFNSKLSVTGDGNYLALFTRYENDINHLDIWVMKEYCQHESWTKMITLARQGPEGSMIFCFRKSGEVLFTVRGPYYRETQTFV